MFSEPTIPPSTEELTWLQASILLDDSQTIDQDSQSGRLSICPSEPGLPPSKVGRNHHRRNSSPLRSVFPVTPRSEWLYRTPRSNSSGHWTANSSPYSRPVAGYYPASLSRSISNASTRTTQTLMGDTSSIKSSSSSSSFWSVLRPRLRPDSSNLLLKTIPSQSQLICTPPELTTPIRKSTFTQTSLSSTLDGHSPSSSRSDSPVTPVSLSSSFGTGRRRSYKSPHRRHRRYPQSDELSMPPPQSSPSKSILTRTSSVSTKASSHTVNKSVKFATLPTVHYATRAYWDMDTLEPDISSIDVNIDSMDLDDDPFANYRSREGLDLEADEKASITSLRELRSATPTPAREKPKPKRMRPFTRLSRDSVIGSKHANSTSKGRPVISSPYALGAYPANTYHVVESSPSLNGRSWTSLPPLKKRNEAAGSASTVVLPIKGGHSCESFRSSKTISLHSIETTSSAGRFRTWLTRTVGWTA